MNRKLLAALGLGLVLVAVAWYVLLWKPAAKQMAAARAADAVAAAKVQSLRVDLMSLAAQAKHAPAEQVALKKLEAAVPSSPELSSALKQLNAAANASGISIVSISPAAPASYSEDGTAEASESSVSLDIAASGTYRQVTNFITDVDALPRLFVVSSVDLSAASSGQGKPAGLTVSLTLDMFYAPTPG